MKCRDIHRDQSFRITEHAVGFQTIRGNKAPDTLAFGRRAGIRKYKSAQIIKHPGDQVLTYQDISALPAAVCFDTAGMSVVSILWQGDNS